MTILSYAAGSYQYDAANRLTLASRQTPLSGAGNVATAYEYDDASRLLSITHAQGVKLLSSFQYSYDHVGNRIQAVEDIKNPVPPTNTPTFTPTNTSTPTDTATSTPTNTPTPTATFTPAEAVQSLQFDLEAYVASGGGWMRTSRTASRASSRRPRRVWTMRA